VVSDRCLGSGPASQTGDVRSVCGQWGGNMRDLETGNSGYVCLHRSLLNKSYSSEEMHLWVVLLMKANYEDTVTRDGVQLKRGELKTGRKQLAEITGINEHKIERLLKRFSDAQQLSIRCTTKYRVISITNYASYQEGAQDLSTDKNSKNNKNKDTNGQNENEIGQTSSLFGVEEKTKTERFDFESVYENYPRKEKKERGMRVLKKQIRTEADFEAFKKAVEVYAKKRQGQDPKYTMNFASFAESWREVLQEAETPTQSKPLGFF
jgi:hypothetical protein